VSDEESDKITEDTSLLAEALLFWSVLLGLLEFLLSLDCLH